MESMRFLATQATAKSVLEMSKAATLQYGEADCPVTSKLSKMSEHRAEIKCHKVSLDSTTLDNFYRNIFSNSCKRFRAGLVMNARTPEVPRA